MRGHAISHSSATMTRQVAERARTTPGLPGIGRAAGRAREEDHALGVTGYVLEGLDDLCLPAAGGARRHGRPHTLVELAPELVDQRLLVLLHLDVALGEQDLAISGLHTQQLHDHRLCQRAWPARPATGLSPRGGGRPPAPARPPGRAGRGPRRRPPPTWPPRPPRTADRPA